MDSWRAHLAVALFMCLIVGRSPAVGEELALLNSSPRPGQAADPLSGCPLDHPLRPALELSLRVAQRSAWIRDYTCLVTERTRVNGRLSDHQYSLLKVRERTESLYLRKLSPGAAQGAEMIYTASANDGLVTAHSPAWRDLPNEVLMLAPDSPRLAAGDLRMPTELGAGNLLRRMIRTMAAESRFGECDAHVYAGARVDGRSCTCIQVVHPVRRADFSCHLYRLFLDDELSLAVRLERYDWPRTPGEEEALIEEQSYTRITVNPGLSDSDFDPRNGAYQFP